MKLRIISFLFVITMLFTAVGAGCSGDSNENNSNGDTDINDSTHLKHCSTNDDCDGNLICHKAIDDGVCLEKCDFGLPDAQGDDYCQLFAEGFKCQPKLGYICTAPCTKNSDCNEYLEGSLCNIDTGLCLSPPECETDSDCSNNLKCMKGVWGGRCMVDCSMTWQGKTGDDLCADEAGEGFVCHDDGNCAPECATDSDCKQMNPIYLCEQGRCKRPNERKCQTNADCQQTESCHGTASASECLVNCSTGINGVSGDDFCNLIFPGTVCHESLGSACRPPCNSDAECQQYSEGLICNNEHKCIPQQDFMACTSSNDCPSGEVCHQELHIRDDNSGTCAASCTVGGSVDGNILQGNDYCDALLQNSVCNESLGGICQLPCESDEDCNQVGENLTCMNGGLCKDSSQISGCQSEFDCPLGEVCHSLVANGVCGAPCTTGADGKTDNAYCNSLAQNYICHPNAGDICAPRCIDDSLCSNLGENLSCRDDGECVPPDTPPICESDNDCEAGEICHKLVPGAACLPPCDVGDGSISGDAFCQLYTSENSHCYETEGGICMDACHSDNDCYILGNDYSCHVESGLCFKAYMPDSCQTNDDCPYSMVCQQTCEGDKKCVLPCESDADCPPCGEGFETTPRYCASGNVCEYVNERKTPCRNDKDCNVDEICHLYASDENGSFGACALKCTNSELCRTIIGSGYICGQDERCEEQETSDIINGQISCESDTDCPVGFLCDSIIGGNVCLPKCNSDEDCSYQPGLFCDQDNRCRRNSTRNIPCQTNEDCSKGEVCYISTNPDNNQCMVPCVSDNDCTAFENGTFCNSQGQCKPPHGTSCTNDSDCAIGNICHENSAGENVCAPPCTSDDDCLAISASLVCTNNGMCKKSDNINDPCESDEDCGIGAVCMTGLDPAICAPPCTSDDDCQNMSANYACRSDATCVETSSLQHDCTNDLQCHIGESCHTFFGVCAKSCEQDSDCTETFGAGFVCFENGECAPLNKEDISCNSNDDCPFGQICHESVGKCAPPCTQNEDCLRFNMSYCNGEFECVNMLNETNCTKDSDCEVGKVCHTDLDMTDNNGNPVGLCLPPCTSSEACNDVSLNYECRADNRCHMISMVEGCDDISDCYPGNICHKQAQDNGVCAKPCSSQGDCARFGENLYCSQDRQCIPIPQSK